LPVEALRDALRALAHGRSLSAPEVRAAFGVIMRGESTPTQTAALLMGLRVRGETPEELAGAVLALRDAMIQLPHAAEDTLVDTCGTGGGTVTTFNISTAAAFVAAAAGVRVAKHGNRSYTSRCGSADVLEALGVPLEVSVETMSSVLAEAGIVFMFAPRMHPAMRHVGPVRRELGVPTIMNLVGPLANPANATRQVIGVGDPERLSLVAEAARALGFARALVVHGAPGLDEISPLGATRVLEARDGVVREWEIRPADHDLEGPASHLACGDPQDNALIIREVLGGRGPEGARAAVALNAAAAIYIAGTVESYADSVTRAVETLDSGAGLVALDRMLAAYATHDAALSP
jgi:anthranilate phosphoribosyltransferase